MHVQEHELGFADLRRILDANSLTFLGFTLDDAASAAYRAMFPDDPHTRDLAHWEALEQARPGTFSAMYQFWAHKSG